MPTGIYKRTECHKSVNKQNEFKKGNQFGTKFKKRIKNTKGNLGKHWKINEKESD